MSVCAALTTNVNRPRLASTSKRSLVGSSEDSSVSPFSLYRQQQQQSRSPSPAPEHRIQIISNHQHRSSSKRPSGTPHRLLPPTQDRNVSVSRKRSVVNSCELFAGGNSFQFTEGKFSDCWLQIVRGGVQVVSTLVPHESPSSFTVLSTTLQPTAATSDEVGAKLGDPSGCSHRQQQQQCNPVSGFCLAREPYC